MTARERRPKRDKREQATGRSSGRGRYAMLPVAVLKSPAVMTLPHAAMKVLVILAARYSGGNNGGLSLTRDIAAEYGLTSNDTLRRSLRELEERGLILRTHPGNYQPAEPANFALTWQAMDKTVHTRSGIATHDYRRWTPKKIDHAVRPSALTGPTIGPEEWRKAC